MSATEQEVIDMLGAELDEDVRAWLEEQGLTDTIPAEDLPTRGYTRAERERLDIWTDRRLEAVHKLAAEIAHNNRVKQARMKMVAETFDAQNASLQRCIDWMVSTLKLHAIAYPYPEGKKSRELVFGTIGLRKAQDKLEVQDDAQAMEWAREHLPEAIKVTESLLKTPLKEWAQSTGNNPPGCTLYRGMDAPYVSIKEARDA